MNISLKTRTLIDNSFRLGYLFSVLIFDLEKIMTLAEKNDYKNLLNSLESDFIIKFNSLEFFFENLYKTNGISEDEFTHIKNFCVDSTKNINKIIVDLKDHNEFSEENYSFIKKLSKDMTDF